MCKVRAVSYTHLDVYKRQEELLPPVLSKQPVQPEERPELPTQIGEVNVRKEQLEKPSQAENATMQEMFRVIMQMREDNKSSSKRMEGMDKKMDSTKEDNQSLSKKMEGLKEDNQSLGCLLYTSRCV